MRPSERPRARLVWRGPSGETYERVMKEGETHIGRANDNEICLLHDKRASRHHAAISVRGTLAYVRDLSSLNGTFLNNERLDVGEYALRDRDILVVGSTEFQVRLPRTDRLRPSEAPGARAVHRTPSSPLKSIHASGSSSGDLDLGPAARGRVYQNGPVTVVELAGAIEVACALLLQASLEAVVADGPGGIVIDLAGVTGLDSAGLGVLVTLNRQCQQARVGLRLAGARPEVRQVLAMTHTGHLFAQANSVAAALATLLEEV